MVIDAQGKDKRGNGTAGAKVTATMTEAAPGSTDVDVATDLSITGKAAQFGRGNVIKDVSDKLLGQFVACLEQRLGAGSGPPRRTPGGGVRTDSTPGGCTHHRRGHRGARPAVLARPPPRRRCQTRRHRRPRRARRGRDPAGGGTTAAAAAAPASRTTPSTSARPCCRCCSGRTGSPWSPSSSRDHLVAGGRD